MFVADSQETLIVAFAVQALDSINWRSLNWPKSWIAKVEGVHGILGPGGSLKRNVTSIGNCDEMYEYNDNNDVGMHCAIFSKLRLRIKFLSEQIRRSW